MILVTAYFYGAHMKQYLALIFLSLPLTCLNATEQKKEEAGEIFTQYQAGIKALGDLKSELSKMRKSGGSWYGWAMSFFGSGDALEMRKKEKQIEQVESSLESMQMRAIDHSYHYTNYLRERVDLLEQQILSVTGLPVEKIEAPKEPELATENEYTLEYEDAEFSPEEAADLAQLTDDEETVSENDNDYSEASISPKEPVTKESSQASVENITSQKDEEDHHDVNPEELDEQLAAQLES